MSDDGTILARARRLFLGPIHPTVIEGAADMPGMRFDGQRWVDETRPDRPKLVVLAKDLPEQWSDLVVVRTPYRANESRKPRSKSRRRGGF